MTDFCSDLTGAAVVPVSAGLSQKKEHEKKEQEQVNDI
jgi:hypothetical protein